MNFRQVACLTSELRTSFITVHFQIDASVFVSITVLLQKEQHESRGRRAVNLMQLGDNLEHISEYCDDFMVIELYALTSEHKRSASRAVEQVPPC